MVKDLITAGLEIPEAFLSFWADMVSEDHQNLLKCRQYTPYTLVLDQKLLMKCIKSLLREQVQ
jgi:hypothetical protein